MKKYENYFFRHLGILKRHLAASTVTAREQQDRKRAGHCPEITETIRWKENAVCPPGPDSCKLTLCFTQPSAECNPLFSFLLTFLRTLLKTYLSCNFFPFYFCAFSASASWLVAFVLGMCWLAYPLVP